MLFTYDWIIVCRLLCRLFVSLSWTTKTFPTGVRLKFMYARQVALSGLAQMNSQQFDDDDDNGGGCLLGWLPLLLLLSLLACVCIALLSVAVRLHWRVAFAQSIKYATNNTSTVRIPYRDRLTASSAGADLAVGRHVPGSALHVSQSHTQFVVVVVARNERELFYHNVRMYKTITQQTV